MCGCDHDYRKNPHVFFRKKIAFESSQSSLEKTTNNVCFYDRFRILNTDTRRKSSSASKRGQPTPVTPSETRQAREARGAAARTPIAIACLRDKTPVLGGFTRYL